MSFEEFTAPIVVIVLAVAGTVWWFKGALERVTEKIYGIEQELVAHTNEERVENAKNDLEHQAVKDSLSRIENILMDNR